MAAADAAVDDVLDQMEKPPLDAAAALELAARVYGLTGGTATEMVSYDDRNFWLQPSDVDGNPFVEAVAPSGYTLKVTNSLDSRDQDFVDGQNQLLAFLGSRGVRCPRPVRDKLGRTHSLESFRADGPGHAVRLLEFVAGDTLGKVPWQDDFARQAGRELARINSVMDGVDIPALRSRQTEWSLWEAPRVLKYLDVVADPARKAIVVEVLGAFQRATQTHADFLREDSGLIHGDFNQFNIVVRRRAEAEAEAAAGAYELAGVIDFGDCHWGPRLFDLAAAATYMALTSASAGAVGGVLRGYSELRPVSATAVELLRVCVCARLCQSLVMGLRAHALHPLNTYVLGSQAGGWPLLEAVWAAPRSALEQQWSLARSAN